MSKKKIEENKTKMENDTEKQPEDQVSAKPADLTAENDALKAELAELKDTLQHLQAEFENYRKRCDRENEQFVLRANEGITKKLLPILDNFELAMNSKAEKEELQKGMELIYSQLFDALECSGLQRIECVGKKFDPYLHEALLCEENKAEPGVVIDELQKGYMLNDKVLRHSKVKISKAKSKDTIDTSATKNGGN
jgi:molecular chaperone GrpE